MNIAVYCSSKPHLDKRYHEMALELGHWMGRNGHTLIYGGVDAGLMHTVAHGVHESGGQVVGVITRNFAPMADRLVDRLITTADLSERKSRMYLISDLHVVLPGGVGTIDEWMSALSQWVVDKREGVGIVFANVDDMYGSMVRQLAEMADTPFAGDRHLAAMAQVANTRQLIDTLEKITNLNPTHKQD